MESAVSLTTTEQDKLQRLESIIEKGINTFYEVGKALAEIRYSSPRLYRVSHNNFEDYCKERWGMGRNYANKLIAAATVKENLGTIVPISESQLRPLAAIKDPEKQREVWKEVVETAPNGKVTAAHVESVVSSKNESSSGEKVKSINDDPPNLYNIKMMWNSCTKVERGRFLKWVKVYFPGYINQ
jgi:hypothetical protein